MKDKELAEWTQGCDRNLICRKLNDIFNISTDGHLKTKDFYFLSYLSVFENLIRIDGSIPKTIRESAIRKAILASVKQKKTNPDNILNNIREEIKKYANSPTKSYFLLTTISFGHDAKLKRKTINQCILSFSRNIPKGFSRARNDIIEKAYTLQRTTYPSNYLNVKIRTSGRSVYEAAENAIDALNLYRSIWNLYFNKDIGYKYSFIPFEPVNKILIGPIHTLHHDDGKLATDIWWYETEFTRSSLTWNPEDYIDNFYYFQKNIQGKIKSNPLREFVNSSLLQYNSALDSRDSTNSFLKLWSLLEKLTNTKINETHKDTVKRASFLDNDSIFSKAMLNHLRNFRNSIVHTGESQGNPDMILFQLKVIVEKLLLFIIKNESNIKTEEELASFLDNPTNQPALLSILSITKKALNYRNKLH